MCSAFFDTVDGTAGLDEIRTLSPNQNNELMSLDDTSGLLKFNSS
ncbi:MAG: hypothetical protein ACPH9T_07775 [Paracoccaceae bacterium]